MPKIRLSFIVALACLAAAPVRAEDAAAAQVRNLVRNLGYGAGIHSFKNYVLRGNDDYRAKAETFLAAAQKDIAALRAGTLRDKEKEALDGIEAVVKQYADNLGVAKKMIAEKKPVKEIDAAVKVDDAPATAGLAVLQAGRSWSALDALESAVGYGGAIHHFKNYVLRGTESYRTNAAAKFKEAAEAIAKLRADKATGDAQKKALDDIEGVLKKYEANLDVAAKMIAEGKGITEIDAAVKVDDTPATAALAVLRK